MLASKKELFPICFPGEKTFLRYTVASGKDQNQGSKTKTQGKDEVKLQVQISVIRSQKSLS